MVKIATAISGSLASRGRQTPRKLRLPSPYQGAESSSLRQNGAFAHFTTKNRTVIETGLRGFYISWTTFAEKLSAIFYFFRDLWEVENEETQ